MKQAIRINRDDNVAVALVDLQPGVRVDWGEGSTVLEAAIPRGHKFALVDIPVNQAVIKYGYPIGRSLEAIRLGAHVHSHNLKTGLSGVLDYTYEPVNTRVDQVSPALNFMGYRRANGEVGIRNELWIVPTVGCVNGIAESLIKTFKAGLDNLEVDAIEVFKHDYGCSQLGDDHENTRTILRDIVLHPNAGGVLVLGLGCENNQVETFKQCLGDFDPNRIVFLETQKVDDEMEAGLQLLEQLYSVARLDKREPVPLSELRVGLKCGGSDGFSGITANPLLGLFSDYLVERGGTTVLTEVPEMFGAETILMNRAASREVFEDTVSLINDFKSYFIKNEQPVYENPSPGNKEGGITTLEEKSLGCTQKCGKAPVVDVLKYGERLEINGLSLLSSPGNDLVASTALAAAGCQMVLFTTGRGTPFGTFVPTIKVSTNTSLYERKKHWIDFNAGSLVEDANPASMLEAFVQYLVDVASGRQANNEKMGYRQIAIFKTGVTL